MKHDSSNRETPNVPGSQIAVPLSCAPPSDLSPSRASGALPHPSAPSTRARRPDIHTFLRRSSFAFVRRVIRMPLRPMRSGRTCARRHVPGTGFSEHQYRGSRRRGRCSAPSASRQFTGPDRGQYVAVRSRSETPPANVVTQHAGARGAGWSRPPRAARSPRRRDERSRVEGVLDRGGATCRMSPERATRGARCRAASRRALGSKRPAAKTVRWRAPTLAASVLRVL